MSVLWTYRQQCSHLIFRQLISKLIQPIIATNVHIGASRSPYSGTKDVHRATVPDEKVSWNIYWPDYKPTEYTAKKVLKNPPWADDSDTTKIKHYNELDEKIDRRSFMGKYDIDQQTNRPRNPKGRTGLSGRGLLGRWGPNHAGDPIVTRWSKDQQDNNKNKALEIILISRRDTGALALPGGMVDPGEYTLETVKREFIEEAMNANPDATKQIEELFKKTITIYKGYIDDPRNTDNAWMESEAINMHDETGELTKDLILEAGNYLVLLLLIFNRFDILINSS
ncbi:unnamed protein product [Rotaria magnacalcarata]|uniref:Nudix hydrolase domain-containing protein n=4 Tax=Rotaria magnacalcarata TaxID=392030 RepID=A0A816V8I3_9BILA|nr:unnamed protein product [Rotaria magnacalcarata]CAF2164715.1 unnamed protein product [Rotaria magnacalcarata]CAF3799493.1 unnamed protein product [Rotaria magnacalcarata]